MSTAGVSTITGRDRALLRAVAAGRCRLGAGYEPVLLVDGLVFADFTAGRRLVVTGWIEPPDPAHPLGPAELTTLGRDALS